MLINKLRDYYGFPDKEQTDYITRATQKMSEELQDDIAAKIIETRPKARGFPDISYLAKFLNDGKSKKVIGFFWSVCNDCKCEYDYKFITCPRCHLAGKKSSGYKVRASDNPPPRDRVIRWNQPIIYPPDDRKYCVNCEHRVSFCLKFGDPDKQCSAQDFEYCPCKQCCAFHKKVNAGMKK